MLEITGTPGPIRTGGLRIRSPALYPAELRAHSRIGQAQFCVIGYWVFVIGKKQTFLNAFSTSQSYRFKETITHYLMSNTASIELSSIEAMNGVSDGI